MHIFVYSTQSCVPKLQIYKMGTHFRTHNHTVHMQNCDILHTATTEGPITFINLQFWYTALSIKRNDVHLPGYHLFSRKNLH